MRVLIAAIAASVSNIVFQMTVDAGYLRNFAWVIPWGWGIAAALWTAWGLTHDKIAEEWLKTLHDKLGRGIHPIRAIICILVFFAVSLGFKWVFHPPSTAQAQLPESSPSLAVQQQSSPPKQQRTTTEPAQSQKQTNSGRNSAQQQQQQRNSGGNNTQQQSSGANSPNITQIGPCNVAQAGSNNTATVNCAPPSGMELAKFGSGIAIQIVRVLEPGEPNEPPTYQPVAAGFWANNKGYAVTCSHPLDTGEFAAAVPSPPLLGKLMGVAPGAMYTRVTFVARDADSDIAIVHVLNSPFERSLHMFAGAENTKTGESETTTEQYWAPAIASDLAHDGDEIIKVAFTQNGGLPIASYDFGHVVRMGIDTDLSNESYRIFTSFQSKDSDCGSPIINNAKTVVGMMHGADGEGIPSTYIAELLKKVE